ncbi:MULTISPECIES: glutamyl-tRNA reductase [unclassified Lysobacter]|uniref:glutamyl-tRNA reductase n=1 Tax=unclassified Lysobacter TaxID=2635362 RepID=UPI0006FFA9AD|nr:MULTISPECIES: glutamyl-tRNA reductase [unclassified Lysobacter]KQZ66696.1 glutamyl-tRNA reductase [Lysobacter sp. Root559]KRC32847.1 glutamyl-tRNA reductase [Lysobacter sp. Root76]KRD67810.1 glutamyl-tRNA reductase [Lysobacter sp. Root96]
MSLFVLGINHQTAPVSLRERVAFSSETVPAALATLRALPQVSEVALLSTCNRTELYAVADDDGRALADWLATHPQDMGDLHAYLYRHRDADAVRHLFRVATGLDSLVLGEPQILGQVKDAWATARNAGSLGSQLDRLFQQAFSTAKRARTDTRIGANPVSVASAAVRLAQESFARLEDSTVLLIGAGETIELAARHLVQAKAKRLLIANRTLSHAQDLASRHGGVALPLSELDRHLGEADIVLSATASREPILHRPQVAAALATRKHRPMLLLDLAVPRDIAADVADLKDTFLYTVDDLERAIEDNRRSRREAATEAEAIVDLQVARFVETMAASTRTAPLKRLRAHGEAARAEVLAKAKQQLDAGQDPAEVLNFLAHTLTNRLLHAPTIALREAALSGNAELARAADKLFPEPPGEASDAASESDSGREA